MKPFSMRRSRIAAWLGVVCLAGTLGPVRAIAAEVDRSPSDTATRVTGDAGAARGPRAFQLSFVTRLQSASFSDDFTVYSKSGTAESLQAPVPGIPIGTYLEQVLLTDPETDFSRGLFKVRETLTTDRGTLTLEAVVLLIASGEPLYGDLGWSRGTITRGTGWFGGATGTVEITGRNAPCDPALERHCLPFPDDPGAGQRQDFNFIIRGVLP